MKISLVGRTNVGKSSLFNALIRKNLAITLDIAGTTRDYQEADVYIDDIPCTIIDTGGFEVKDKFVWTITEKAIAKSDLLLFVVSAKDGLSAEDYECAKVLRKFGKEVVLVVNKADKFLPKYDLNDFYQLGFEKIAFTSCTNNSGLTDVLDHIMHYIEIWQKHTSDHEAVDVEDEEVTENENSSLLRDIRLAIIGRPNAGKSTILNGILKEERVLTSPVAGTTRDSIHTKFSCHGKQFEIIDTAGIRKKNKHGDELETASVKMAKRSIKLADIVMIVIDCSMAFDKQDLILVSLVVDQGKVPILVFNKWDLIDDKESFLADVEYKVSVNFSQIIGMECMFFSAINPKQKYDKLFSVAANLYKRAHTKISTALINKLLRVAEEKHSPPRVHGRKLRVKYGLQTSFAPHKLVFFFSQDSSRVPEHYLHYLRNFFAEELNLYGVPVLISARSSENPYAVDSKK